MKQPYIISTPKKSKIYYYKLRHEKSIFTPVNFLDHDKCDHSLKKTKLTNSIVGIAIKYIRKNIHVFLAFSKSE